MADFRCNFFSVALLQLVATTLGQLQSSLTQNSWLLHSHRFPPTNILLGTGREKHGDLLEGCSGGGGGGGNLGARCSSARGCVRKPGRSRGGSSRHGGSVDQVRHTTSHQQAAGCRHQVPGRPRLNLCGRANARRVLSVCQCRPL